MTDINDLFQFLFGDTSRAELHSSEPLDDALRARLDRFVNGECDDGEIQALCAEIQHSQEALSYLAELMKTAQE